MILLKVEEMIRKLLPIIQQTSEMSRQSKTDYLVSYREIDEDNLLEEPAVETRQQPAVSAQSTDKVPERPDLADTFNCSGYTWT